MSQDQSPPDLFLQRRSQIERFFIAELYELAAQAAKDYLVEAEARTPQHWNYGNAVHHANLYLGLISLRKEVVEEAKGYLLASGRTPGSPQLNSFGPNVLLADRLLRGEEQVVVLEYLDLCGKFWKMGTTRLAEWRGEVATGGVPNWSPQFVY